MGSVIAASAWKIGPFLSIGLVVSLFAGDTLLQVTGMEETIRLIWTYYKPW